MPRQDIGDKIAEKMDRARAKLAAKLETVQARESELQPKLEALEKDLEQLDAELDALSPSEDPARYAKLEVRRERLLAKQERLHLRQEIFAAKIEGYEEGIAQLQQQWGQFPGLTGLRPTPQPPDDLEAERRKILDMVADGTITPAEAARLLEAMEGQAKRRPASPSAPARIVRVRVSDTETDRVRVNIKLPLGLIRTALRKGRGAAPDLDIGGVSFDVDELEELLRAGVQGHIIDIVDEEDGERVEVLVE
jgi:hypothetical protein